MECPKCEATLSTVHAKSIIVRARRDDWRGIAYVCPSCRSILSVQIDPLATQNDLVAKIVKSLGGK